MNSKDEQEDWLFVIKPKNKFLSLNLKEVWQYRVEKTVKLTTQFQFKLTTCFG